MPSLPQLSDSDLARFWSKVQKTDNFDDCWNWLAGLHTRGYGQFFLVYRGRRGSHFYAHRVSYFLANGEIPDGLSVLHKCDNPKCVNPNHLFAGTHQDNMDDMHAKGRGAKGDRHGSHTRPERHVRGELHSFAKLTDAEVEQIRYDYANRIRMQKDMAKDYGVSKGHICDICRRIKRKGIVRSAG